MLPHQLLAHSCDEQQRRELQAFFKAKKIGGSERFIALGAEVAAQCIALRRRGRDAVARYLDGASQRPR